MTRLDEIRARLAHRVAPPELPKERRCTSRIPLCMGMAARSQCTCHTRAHRYRDSVIDFLRDQHAADGGDLEWAVAEIERLRKVEDAAQVMADSFGTSQRREMNALSRLRAALEGAR